MVYRDAIPQPSQSDRYGGHEPPFRLPRPKRPMVKKRDGARDPGQRGGYHA